MTSQPMTKINIEIIYPLADEQELIELTVAQGTSIQQAIEESGILNKYPAIDLATNKVGIFSKAAKLNDVLRQGDRIEIYRPLIADPKEARKKKALKKS